MTVSTASSPMLRGVPERGSSCKPSNLCMMKRLRHPATVARLRPSFEATVVLLLLSAQANTMRQRVASA